MTVLARDEIARDGGTSLENDSFLSTLCLTYGYNM